jgi:exportin-5
MPLTAYRHAHACHIPSNWAGLPPEMRDIVERVLTDRFWQAGISEGSKDDFYARVLDKKHTMEGLASTIRGSIRFVRETCYAIIYCMSRLDMQFYGFNELPGPLAHALLANSFSLSPHQLINLLNLTRYLVDNCPVGLREHFLPPILAACFQQMDAKVNFEWQKLDQQQSVQAGGDALTEEMKSESILRQLTYTAVMMVADFLDPARMSMSPDALVSITAKLCLDPFSAADEQQKYPTLREFCLIQSSIVEPLLMFCTHAIRMRDTRCCGIILRVFRSIVPEFQAGTSQSSSAQSTENKTTLESKTKVDTTPISAETAQPIREFISSNVLQACIQSLHEPYFVELQKDLALLISSIFIFYTPLTNTPRSVVLSLPNMDPAEVDKAIQQVSQPSVSSRYQRGVVLDLLKDLKGVSISEMGKLSNSVSLSKPHAKRSTRSRMAEEFMTAPPPTSTNGSTTTRGAASTKTEDDLEGVAGLFEAS